MANATFSPGDLVRLKSGGPLLTVMYESERGEVAFAFFNDAQELITQSGYRAAMFEAVTPEEANKDPRVKSVKFRIVKPNPPTE